MKKNIILPLLLLSFLYSQNINSAYAEQDAQEMTKQAATQNKTAQNKTTQDKITQNDVSKQELRQENTMQQDANSLEIDENIPENSTNDTNGDANSTKNIANEPRKIHYPTNDKPYNYQETYILIDEDTKLPLQDWLVEVTFPYDNTVLFLSDREGRLFNNETKNQECITLKPLGPKDM